jgi:hypothetical protein
VPNIRRASDEDVRQSRTYNFSLDSLENRGIFSALAADGRPRGVLMMHWLKTNNLNPGLSGRAICAISGEALFAYRPEAELTKETPPPR